MNGSPQHSPTESPHPTTTAAGPQSALGIPSAGAVARPAALYMTLSDGTVLPVCDAHFRDATEREREQYPFAHVLTITGMNVAWAVNATYECYLRELQTEPAHDADRESHYLALYGGAK